MLISSDVQRVFESNRCDLCNYGLSSLSNNALSIKLPNEMKRHIPEKSRGYKVLRLCILCVHNITVRFVKNIDKEELPLYINYQDFVFKGDLKNVNIAFNDIFLVIGAGVLENPISLNNMVRTLVSNRLRDNL